MQLIYRGEMINYPAYPVSAYQKPDALNWRYQVAGETYGDVPMPVQAYKAPRVLNWRWQMAIAS